MKMIIKKEIVFILLFAAISIILPIIWIPKDSVYFSEEDNFGNYQKIIYKNTSSWDYSVNAGNPNDPGQYTVIIPNGIVHYFLSHLGLPNDIVQKVFLSLILLATFWAVNRFLRLFTDNKLIIIFGVLFYYLNFYTKSTPFYSAKMYQLILIPLIFTWTYLFLRTKQFKYAIYNFICLFIFQGIFSNLAAAASTFIVYFLAIAYFYVNESIGFISFLKSKIIPLIIYFCLLLPILINSGLVYVFSINNSIDSLKETNNFTALSSPVHLILQLRGSWWEFLNSSEGVSFNHWLWFYSNFFIALISFLFVGIGLYTLIIKKPDKRSLFFLVIFIIAIFLSSGSSFYPLLYKWLLDTIPFFFIFREPWSKFSPLLVWSLMTLITISLSKIKPRYQKGIIILSIFLILIRGIPFFSSNFFDRNTKRWSIPFIKLPVYWRKWQSWSINNRDKTVLLKPINYFKRNWYQENFGNVDHPLANIFGYTNSIYKFNNNDLGGIINYFIDHNNTNFIKITSIDYLLDQKDIEKNPLYFDTRTALYNQKFLQYFQEKPILNFSNKLFLHVIKPEFALPRIYEAKNIFLTKNIKGLIRIISEPDYQMSSVTYYFDDVIDQMREIKALQNELNNNNSTSSLRYFKLNDTNYRISFSHLKKPTLFVFNTNFNKNWQLYSSNKKIDDAYHIRANGYANSWIIDPVKICSLGGCYKNSDDSYNVDLTIEYIPQILKKTSTTTTLILRPLITSNNLYALNTIPDYPFVSTKVGSLKYFITNFLEVVNQRQNIQNKLVFTYAGKRISELEKWGNDIPVLGKIHTLPKLTSWWLKQKPAWWQIHKFHHFNSWEASLARYDLLWEEELRMINQVEPKNIANTIMTLKGYARNHQRKINLIIYNSNKSQQEKKYLFNVTNEIYTDLNKQLDSYIPEYSLSTIDYSLNNLHQDKEYGMYDLSLIMEDFPSYLNSNPSLKINNAINLERFTTENLLSFKNIIINEKSRNLQLKLKSVHFPIKEIKWLKTYDKQKKQYQYSLPIPKIPEELTYFLNFQYQFNQQVILQIIKNEKVDKNVIERVLLSIDLLPINQETLLSEPLTLPDINNVNYQFLLISYQPLSENEIKSIQIDFLPFLEPEILLEKTGEIPNHQPIISKNTNNVNILTKLTTILVILLLFFIFLPRFQAPRWLTLIGSKVKWRVQSLLKFLKQTRFIFKITLTLLGLCTISTIFNNKTVTENLAIWFYIFLIMGVFQSIYEAD